MHARSPAPRVLHGQGRRSPGGALAIPPRTWRGTGRRLPSWALLRARSHCPCGLIAATSSPLGSRRVARRASKPAGGRPSTLEHRRPLLGPRVPPSACQAAAVVRRAAKERPSGRAAAGRQAMLEGRAPPSDASAAVERRRAPRRCCPVRTRSPQAWCVTRHGTHDACMWLTVAAARQSSRRAVARPPSGVHAPAARPRPTAWLPAPARRLPCPPAVAACAPGQAKNPSAGRQWTCAFVGHLPETHLALCPSQSPHFPARPTHTEQLRRSLLELGVWAAAAPVLRVPSEPRTRRVPRGRACPPARARPRPAFLARHVWSCSLTPRPSARAL